MTSLYQWLDSNPLPSDHPLINNNFSNHLITQSTMFMNSAMNNVKVRCTMLSSHLSKHNHNFNTMNPIGLPIHFNQSIIFCNFFWNCCPFSFLIYLFIFLLQFLFFYFLFSNVNDRWRMYYLYYIYGSENI